MSRLRRYDTRTWLLLALVVGYAAQVVFRLSLVTGQDYPVVSPDEQTYLVIARVLAGLPPTEVPDHQLIPGGYPLLISPALRISHDPVQVYHLVMVINALISSLVLPFAYWALRRLQVARPQAYVFATATAVLPPVVFYSQYALADTPLPVLVLAWLIGMHGLLSDSTPRRRIGFALLAGLAGGYTLLVHDRGGVIVALTALVLLAVLVLGWAPRIATTVALGCLAVMFAAKQLMTSWLIAHTDDAHPSAVGNALLDGLSDPHLLRRTEIRTIGHIWYFTTSTWGLAALVLIVATVVVARPRHPRADRVVAFLMVALLGGIALAAAAALPNDHRIDTITYARYLSPLVPVYFVTGSAVLNRVSSRRTLLYLGLAATGLTLAITAVLVHMAHNALRLSYFIVWGLPDATFLSSLWTGNWSSFHAGWTTVAALAVLAVVLAATLLARSGRRTGPAMAAVGVLLALFATYATTSITDHITRPNTAWRYGDATGFLRTAQIRTSDNLAIDYEFHWQIRMTMDYAILDGRVWTMNLLKGDAPPAKADVAILAPAASGLPPQASWPNAPAGWHVTVSAPEKGYIIWRRD